MNNHTNQNSTGKAQKSAQEAVKNETSSPAVRRAKTILFELSVVIMISAFGLLTFLVITFPTFSVDLYISRSLQSINNSSFLWLMTLISWVGFTPQCFIISFIIILIIYILGYHWEAVTSLVAAIIVPLLNLLIKTLVHRSRPSTNLIHVTNLLNSYSFPSGHVMFYTGFFGFMCFLTFILIRPSWIRTLLLVIFGSNVALIGVSRVYLGEHWASDVVGAYLLGGLCLIGFIRLYRFGKSRFFVQQPVAKDNKQV